LAAVGFAADNFAFSLMSACRAMGSLLDVAQVLGVQPKQVYRWIADLDRPSDAQRRELERQLDAIATSPFHS
jgi:uncharacterized protein (DUF1778 family)